MIPLLWAAADALSKCLHYFLKMPPIFKTTKLIIHNSPFIITFRHPQKSKGERKSVKFQCRMKSIFIIGFGFSSVPQNFTPFPKTTIFQFNTQSFTFTPIKQQHLIWIFKIKNKKKESKDKFQVFRKKSSSPPGFKKNLHPYRFATTFTSDFTLILPMMYRVVFFLKNFFIWNLPLEQTAFFFSFFSFEKFYRSSVARHTCISRENPRKIENLINF